MVQISNTGEQGGNPKVHPFGEHKKSKSSSHKVHNAKQI